MNLDFVQWWEAVMLAIYIVGGLLLHGDPKEGHHDFRIDFIGLLVALPPIGRIFHWW